MSQIIKTKAGLLLSALNLIAALMLLVSVSLFWELNTRLDKLKAEHAAFEAAQEAEFDAVSRDFRQLYNQPVFIKMQKQYLGRTIDIARASAIEVREELKKKLLMEQVKVETITKPETLHDLLSSDGGSGRAAKAIRTAYYGIEHVGLLEGSGGKRLVIYHGGHGSNPFDNEPYSRLRQWALDAGFDILTLSMTGTGLNMTPRGTWFPVKFNIRSNPEMLRFQKHTTISHYLYGKYFDPSKRDVDPLALLLSGNYHIIRSAIKDYDNVMMIGFSGGGWATTMLAALIPEIQSSYSFAGSLPLAYRAGKGSAGDWEQTHASIWKTYDYWDFYILALYSKTGERNRLHHLIYNERDTCCFANPHAAAFKKLVDSFSIRELGVSIVPNREHKIDLEFIRTEILKSAPPE